MEFSDFIAIKAMKSLCIETVLGELPPRQLLPGELPPG